MCGHLRAHVAGRTHELATDPVLLAATQRWLEIIGEAAANVSAPVREAHPEVAWRDAIGMRNILGHAYFHLDLDVLRDAVETDVPELREHVVRIVEELE